MCTKKEDWCYYSNAKHTSKGLYLPILTNERSSARMIGQAIAVPFLLFLFHTIKRNLLLINIGARGSTPTHRPEWMSKASCSYRPGFYLLITYDLIVPINTDLWLKRACSALAFIPLSQPQERERFACFGNAASAFAPCDNQREGRMLRKGSFSHKSYYYESCGKPLRSLCPYVLFDLPLLLANQWNSFSRGVACRDW